MNIKRIIAAGVLAAAVIATGTACTVTSTAPDEQALVYNTGPMAQTQFQEYVGPGQKSYSDMFDTNYTYPAGQRTVVFSNAQGADFGAFSAPSKDSVTLTIDGQARFTLTSNPVVLQEFHERIGLKFRDDWTGVLRTYLQQPLNRAITEATQGFEWTALYGNPQSKAEWERKVKELLPQYIKQSAGGDYFTVEDITIQKPAIPAELQSALTKAQENIQLNKAQQEQNTRNLSEAQGAKPLVDLLGVDGYLVYKAIQDGRVQVLPIPNGSAVVAAK